MRSPRKTSAWVVGLLVATYVLIAVSSQVYLRAFLLPGIDQDDRKVEEFQARILEDLKLLDARPVFPKSNREKNAERFLTGFIGWSGTEALHTLEHDQLIDLKNRHLGFWETDEKFEAFSRDEEVQTLDLAWVDQLLAYDSFDMTTHPRFEEALERAKSAHGIERTAIMATFSFPEYSELRFAALARAAQLHHAGRTREGLELIRHVTHLVMTNDNLISALMTVAMLKTERKLAERWGASDWKSIDEERTEAMKRTAWAWPGVIRSIAKKGSLGVFEPYVRSDLGACSFMVEPAVATELLLSDYLQPTLVFEPNLTERLERQRGVFSRALTLCSHPELGVFAEPVASPLMIGRGIPNPARIPFLRRAMGLTLVSLASPSFFKFYEEKRKPASQ